MFKIKYWYSPGGVEKNTGEKIAIRCSNCGKETIIDVDNLNTTYQDIITTFVLNTMLHNFGMWYPKYQHLSLILFHNYYTL